jgi:hypothetical protein
MPYINNIWYELFEKVGSYLLLKTKIVLDDETELGRRMVKLLLIPSPHHHHSSTIHRLLWSSITHPSFKLELSTVYRWSRLLILTSWW